MPKNDKIAIIAFTILVIIVIVFMIAIIVIISDQNKRYQDRLNSFIGEIDALKKLITIEMKQIIDLFKH